MTIGSSPEGKVDRIEGVRSLERGLALLRRMNESPNISVSVLSRELDLPRSSVYRLLATLEGLGYVSQMAGVKGYRLRHNVRSLSDGYRDDDWLEAAWPELLETTKQLVWPIAVFTFDVNDMVIRRATHRYSTMSIDYGMDGRRMSLTGTAAGRAYLAFCPARERDWLLSQPAVASQMNSGAERDLLMERLKLAARNGYAARVGGVMPKTSSLAVPVMLGATVLCSVSVIWIRSTQSTESVIAKLAPAMKDLGKHMEQIAADLQRQNEETVELLRRAG